MKKINVFIVMLVFIMSFCFIAPSNIIKAGSVDWTIDNWDTYNVGDREDSGSYGDWAGHGDFEVSNAWGHSGSQSWRATTLGADVGGGTVTREAYYNMTTEWDYINSVTIYFKSDHGSTGANNIVENRFILYNDTIEVCKFYSIHGIGGNDQFKVYIIDYDSTLHLLENNPNLGAGDYERYMVITHVTTNIFNYSLYYQSNATYIHGLDISSRNEFTHTTFDQLNWEHYVMGATGGTATSFMDDIIFTEDETPPPPGSGDEGTIYINIYDSLTGNLMYLVGSDVTDHFDLPLSRQFTYPDQLLVKIESDLWVGEYDSNMFGQTVTITDEWDDGSLHTLSFSGYYTDNILGWVDTYSKSWWNFTVTFAWYKNRVYSFTATSTDMGIMGYPYCDDTSWQTKGCMSDTDKHKFCLNKGTYNIGETIYLKWYMPDKGWLAKNGDYAEGWRLTLWDESQFTFDPLYMWWEGSNWFAPPSCDWIYFEVLVDDLYGFTTNYQEYSFKLMNFDTLWPYFTPAHLNFWVTGEGIAPEADLLYITPNPPRTFEQASIAWTSNCTVKITIEQLGSNNEPEVFYSEVQPGVSFVNTTFWLPGEYLARIYVYDGLVMQPVPFDTLAFNVTGEQTPWPGGEYLEIVGDPYYVAGEIGRNVTFRFKTLIDNASLTITDADGGTSWFSRVVNKSDYMHSFWLPSFAPLGKWTATLDALATHTRYFWVIAEEGNYVEFVKHVYYDDEPFSIKIAHTRYIKLDFYKEINGEWIPQGEPWLMDIGTHVQELLGIAVPLKYATPTVGTWRVEMNRLNEYQIVKYIAGDNCTVIHRPDTPVTPGDSELGSLVQNAFPDPTVRTIIGLVICLVITLLPYLVGLKMKERHVTINIPTVIYAICFGVGVAVSYILGFFGIEILFFIVFILISIMALMFLYGKKSASSGSEA